MVTFVCNPSASKAEELGRKQGAYRPTEVDELSISRSLTGVDKLRKKTDINI